MFPMESLNVNKRGMPPRLHPHPLTMLMVSDVLISCGSMAAITQPPLLMPPSFK